MDNAIKTRNEAYAAFEHIPAKHQARAVAIARKGQEAFDAGQFERAANEWRQMMRLATMKNPKGKLHPFHSGKRPGYQNVNRAYLRKLGLPDDKIDRIIARQLNGATLADAYHAEGIQENPQGPSSKFEHETVRSYPSLKRQGLTKIRTITTPSGHRVRVAFPPGRRRKGSGRVQSILHPMGENPVIPFRPRRSKIYAAPATREDMARREAFEAANDNMEKAGRKTWDIEDFNVAVRLYNAIVGAPLNPPMSNPRRTKIYQHCLKIFASKKGMPHKCDPECKAHDHNYVHKFEHQNICIYGLPNGSILIEG